MFRGVFADIQRLESKETNQSEVEKCTKIWIQEAQVPFIHKEIDIDNGYI